MAASSILSAQDSNYWSLQYGNRARLLRGSVIGGDRDLSAVYYNPGGLALVDVPQLLLAGSVVEWTRYRLEDVGRGEVLNQSSLALSPSLVAEELPMGLLGDHRLAYSILTRQRSDVELRGPIGSGLEDLVPAIDFQSSDFEAEVRLSEYWAGVTWAASPGERWGVGISTFAAVRKQSADFSDFSQVLGKDQRAAVAAAGRSYNYQNVRLLWKLGLNTELEGWELGVSMTTSSVSLWGSGSTGFNRTLVAQHLDAEGNPITDIANDVQETPAMYRSPFSIGLGASRDFGSTKLHLSIEWFDAVAPYTVLDSELFEGQTSGEIIDTDITTAADSVLNWVVGVERDLAESRRVYASFRSDFSATAEKDPSLLNVVNFDLYHVAGGGTFSLGSSDFTLGSVVSYGRKTAPQSGRIPGLSDPVTLDFFRITIILGVSFSFE